ncbi:hypothetical protein D3C85_1236740 [compost metagenome]
MRAGFGTAFAFATLAFTTLAFAGLLRGSQLIALRQGFSGKRRGREVDTADQCNSDQANTGFVRLDTRHVDTPDHLRGWTTIGRTTRVDKPGCEVRCASRFARSIWPRWCIPAVSVKRWFCMAVCGCRALIHSDTRKPVVSCSCPHEHPFKKVVGYFLKATTPCVVAYGYARIRRLVRLASGLYRFRATAHQWSGLETPK